MAQGSKSLHLRARGVTTDPGSNPDGITPGREWESHNELILCSRGNSGSYIPVAVLMRDSFIIELDGFL